MARKESKENSFADLVARLKEMSNASPDKERAELMEAANKEPKILDDKDISLADIAKLAGIKEYTEQPKVSPKAEKLVESITKTESSIAQAIAESDADESLATNIKKAVTEESNRLDKIAELEAQLAELKTEQKDEQTYDAKSFREVVNTDMQEYIAKANENELVELYNAVSDNEAVYNEESSNILVKTPETAEMIADAEEAETPDDEVVAEKDDEGVEHTHDDGTKHTHTDGDKEHTHDKEPEGTPNSTIPLEDTGEDVELETAEDKFTNDLDPKK
tara:strand:- start:7742 stop:8572 length:831 start_codon:yes stop_codon:yes gene_type:complete